jgi:type I restriction enzyme, S subunit
MNADRLLAHYEEIADIPDAVPRLRRFILDLAVRGKLVPQDPNDEPASELLKRIAAVNMLSGIKPQDFGSALRTQSNLLPSQWEWTFLGAVTSKTGSGSTPRGGKSSYRESGIPFLRSQNVHDDGLRLEDVAFIDELTHSRMNGTHVLAGDLLLNITGGSIGRTCVVPSSLGRANVSQHVAIIRPTVAAMAQFLHILILSPYFQTFIHDSQTGAGRGGLPKNRMDRIPVAIPPLAEQHRIVAKVDELMALCNQLEAARSACEAARDRLTSATLARLPTSDPETLPVQAEFALGILPELTTRAEQITHLRKTILGLAVRGKLVPQDPNDEPASELLKRVKDERDGLVRLGEVRKADPVTEFIETSAAFFAPPGWAIAPLQSVCTSVTDGDHLPPPKAPSGIPFLVIGNIRSRSIDFKDSRFVPSEYYEALDPIRRPRQGDLLYTLVGSYGIPVLVRDDRPFCVQRHIGVLRPSKHIDVYFLAYALESQWVFDQASVIATGIAQKTSAFWPSTVGNPCPTPRRTASHRRQGR